MKNAPQPGSVERLIQTVTAKLLAVAEPLLHIVTFT
jgi:hypothetical protein